MDVLFAGFFLVFFGLFMVIVLGITAIARTRPFHLNSRYRFIQDYRFSNALKAKLQRKYPELTTSQIEEIFEGLRQYFVLCLRAGAVRGNIVAMPSRAVDDAWHEFILFTQEYDSFCRQAFGKYLHHTPHSKSTSEADRRKQLATAWYNLRSIEAQDKNRFPIGAMAGVPFLFAIDQSLAIPDGMVYSSEDVAWMSEQSAAMMHRKLHDSALIHSSSGSESMGTSDVSCGPTASDCGDSSSFSGSDGGGGGCSAGSSSGCGGGSSGCGGGGSGCGGGGGCGGGS